GVVVVDVEKGGNIDDLPKTVMSKTGGGGWHLYYAYSNKRPINNYGRIRDLTDIRGDGGYVIAPPSTHKSGNQYTWITPMDRASLAEFPYQILDNPFIERSQRSQRSGMVEKGKRNQTVAKEAGKILHSLPVSRWEKDGWAALLDWNSEKCAPPLEQKELRSTWESIKRAENNSHEQKRNKQSKKMSEIYSRRFDNGVIIEAYYDSTEEETGFLVYEQGSISIVPHFIYNEKTYIPPPPTNTLIEGNFVKLPSTFTDFESENALLKDIRDFIHEYVEITEEFENIASFFTLFGWVYDSFQELPYLRLIGDFGSGKSRMLKVMGALGYKSIALNGATSVSAIFRMINDIKGWVILDEADFRYSDTTNEIVKILNAGFQKGIPVFRSESTGNKNTSFDPKPFDIFCPKVIATRSKFNDEALESRCLSYPMQTMTREDIPENLDDDFEAKALALRNKLVTFRFHKIAKGITNKRLPKMLIEPRLKQIMTPIYSVLDSEEGKEQILQFIRKKQDVLYEERFSSFEGEILQALVKAREDGAAPTMKDIADIHNIDFSPKYKISPKKIGHTIDNIFHLKKKKSARGYLVINDTENEHILAKLILKFGINKPVLNDMNNMNVQAGNIEDVAELFGGAINEADGGE
ncbi:bifunctional DNA primase/polymerase, partial [Patescibacteria group bacterium]|nr:bifunctional DNA primase/polymerase [Patescibacteria group bacterium]